MEELQQQAEQAGSKPTAPDRDAGRGTQHAATAPESSETGRFDGLVEDGSWGELPPYLRFLHKRGAAVEVPERYRRLYEAYLKAANKKR